MRWASLWRRAYPGPRSSRALKPCRFDVPEPTPEPEPTPAPAAEPEAFSVAAYAKQHGLDGRELRKKLRADGLRAPYTLEQVEKVIK